MALAEGACREAGMAALFDDEARVVEAKAVCAGCPVVRTCLAYALPNEPLGVWGATTPSERRALNRNADVVDPWRRQLAAEFRADLVGPGTADELATKWGMTARTVERNRNRLRALTEAA